MAAPAQGQAVLVLPSTLAFLLSLQPLSTQSSLFCSGKVRQFKSQPNCRFTAERSPQRGPVPAVGRLSSFQTRIRGLESSPKATPRSGPGQHPPGSHPASEKGQLCFLLYCCRDF